MFTSAWIKNLANGAYLAEVTGLTHARFAWNGALDPTANDVDSNGNRLPDESHTIPHAAADAALPAWADFDSSDDDESDILTATLADELAWMLTE